MTNQTSKIEFYLIPKVTKKIKVSFELAENLKSEVTNMIRALSNLGYSSSKLAEVKYALLSQNAHDYLVEETSFKEKTRIGYIHYDWKPVFILHNFCDSNLDSFRNEIEQELSKKDLVRIEYFPPKEGTDEYEELFEEFLNPSESFDDLDLESCEVPVAQNKKFVSLEEMIEEMITYKWSKFGMPDEYNQKEETIWEQ